MILTVSGWRYWTDVRFVHAQLEGHDDMFGLSNIHLRVGCCKTGVDKFVRDWTVACGHRLASFTVYYADWSLPGHMGGPIRNGQMLRGETDPTRTSREDPNPLVVADRLLAFPEPGVRMRSPGSGTVGCIFEAHLLGIDLDIPGYRKEER